MAPYKERLVALTAQMTELGLNMDSMCNPPTETLIALSKNGDPSMVIDALKKDNPIFKADPMLTHAKVKLTIQK